MSTFEERKKGYENKFAHDLEVDFKLHAKRNRLLGVWAAEIMNLDIDEKAKYAMELMDCEVEGVVDETVLKKVLGDFRDKGIDIDEEEIHKEMDRLLSLVIQEIQE